MKVGIIGAPLDLGADRRGVDMGPSAIRYAGLEMHLRDMGCDVRDFGNIAAPVPESTPTGETDLKYLAPIARMAEELSNRVAEIAEDGWFPLTLGGDHSVSLGSVAGISRARRVGLVWLDAHGDFNTTETSPSGNIHGMVLAALAGLGDRSLVEIGGHAPKVEAHNVALIGVRELDHGEKELLRSAGAQVYTMHDIDRVGLPSVLERALGRMGSDLDGVHLSLDLDVVDPLQAPGVGTPVLGGLNYREAHLALELMSSSQRMVSMDIFDVNPVLDRHNETATLAVQFTMSDLGKRIF